MRSRREARRREIESGSLHNSRADAQPRTFPSQVPSSPLTSARYVPGDHPFMADDVYQAALHEDMVSLNPSWQVSFEKVKAHPFSFFSLDLSEDTT